MVGEVSLEIVARERMLVGGYHCGTRRRSGSTRSAETVSEALKKAAAQMRSAYEDS